MNVVQHILLAVYERARRSGLLSAPSGRWLFTHAYDLYKVVWEAGPIYKLRSLVVPGTWIIDVGANVGFFTKRFASWVSCGGSVLALEPERVNFVALEQTISPFSGDRVHLLRAAAAEVTGTLYLRLSENNHVDHRLAEDGVSVPSLTLDDLMTQYGWPAVSLIKIDVQGAEGRVLDGAGQLIERCHPALFVEIDTDAGRVPPGAACVLMRQLMQLGYVPHRLPTLGGPVRLSMEEALEYARRRGYADFLFLHRQKHLAMD